MADIINKARQFYLSKSVIVRLILINVGVFLTVSFAALLASIAGTPFSLLQWLELPSSFGEALLCPWTFITYMFTHYQLLHILFNMLWLYCFGIIFLDHYRDREFSAAYLIGGLAGALFYLAGNALLPQYSSGGLVGSSAAVLSVAAATVVRAPNYHINLWLIGMVKIKWVAVVCIVFALLTAGPHNIGGHFAHIGGIGAGTLFALNARYGWLKPKRRKSSKILPKLHERPVTATAQRQPTRQEIERQLDELLDKVNRSGYSSLSAKEKKELNDLSTKIKL